LTVIDAYTHFYPKPYLTRLMALKSEKARAHATRWARRAEVDRHYIDVAARLVDLDKFGIDYEVTAVSQDVDPNNIGALEDGEELSLAGFLNDQMARVMEESHGRIFSLGTVPFGSIESAGIDEMRRAVRDLGLKGFMVLSNVNGTPIDKFQTFWAEVEKLGVPVYIHPIDPISNASRSYEDEYDLMHVFGWPFETTLILARLVFSGTLERYPGLKILAHHLGGMIPFFAGRINESYSKTMGAAKAEQQVKALEENRSAIDLFRNFYYDTAIGGSVDAIRCGLGVFGPDRIIFGTDYPFGPESGRSRLRTYPGTIRELGLSSEDTDKIFEKNARRLVGI